MADFSNSITTALPGFGTPSQRRTSIDNNLAAGTGTYTLNFSPGIRKGMIRVRTKGTVADPPTAPTTGVTTTSLVITASDGFSTFVILADMGGIAAANQMLDRVAPFNLDIAATIVTATIITAGGQVYVDVEGSGGG